MAATGAATNMLDPATVYGYLVKTAKEAGVLHIDDACTAECLNYTCRGTPVPVHLWRHKVSGVCRVVWKYSKPTKEERQNYQIVKKFSCFFACKQQHLHLCSGKDCDSIQSGMYKTNAQGNCVCLYSGNIVQMQELHNWKEAKKGSHASRGVRHTDPGASQQFSQQILCNVHDKAMVRSARLVVFHCMFSPLRSTIHNHQQMSLEKSVKAKAQQYAKSRVRQGKYVMLAQLTRIGIQQGYFSSCTYKKVLQAHDQETTLRTLAPLVVSLYKTINALCGGLFKAFPMFACAVLYLMIEGVRIHDYEIVYKMKYMRILLPHPTDTEDLFRSMSEVVEKLYPDASSPAQPQRNFLTKIQKQIQATLRTHVTTLEHARTFKAVTDQRTVELRNLYYDIVANEGDDV